jgi:hypothetical protein
LFPTEADPCSLPQEQVDIDIVVVTISASTAVGDITGVREDVFPEMVELEGVLLDEVGDITGVLEDVSPEMVELEGVLLDEVGDITGVLEDVFPEMVELEGVLLDEIVTIAAVELLNSVVGMALSTVMDPEIEVASVVRVAVGTRHSTDPCCSYTRAPSSAKPLIMETREQVWAPPPAHSLR